MLSHLLTPDSQTGHDGLRLNHSHTQVITNSNRPLGSLIPNRLLDLSIMVLFESLQKCVCVYMCARASV